MTIRKETRSITDLLADTAHRKSRAAQARFAGTPAGLEKPRDVYLTACASIGTYLEDAYGIKYTKSTQSSQKRSGHFTFRVSFQSSRNNVPGEHVALWIHGNVLSPKLKQWREAQGFPRSFDGVAGGQIGNLRTNDAWLEWDLADPKKRDETVRDAIKAIEELALPYFANFEDLPSLIDSLMAERIPQVGVEALIDLLMCFADPIKARAAAAEFLRRMPNLTEPYHRAYAHYADVGLNTPRHTGYAHDLARASQLFGFGDLTKAAPQD